MDEKMRHKTAILQAIKAFEKGQNRRWSTRNPKWSGRRCSENSQQGHKPPFFGAVFADRGSKGIRVPLNDFNSTGRL